MQLSMPPESGDADGDELAPGICGGFGMGWLVKSAFISYPLGL